MIFQLGKHKRLEYEALKIKHNLILMSSLQTPENDPSLPASARDPSLPESARDPSLQASGGVSGSVVLRNSQTHTPATRYPSVLAV
jgi:hypothetical protein